MNLQTLLKKINALESELQLALAKDASIVGSFFQQGGNAFGATAVLGTTDANALQVITNNTTRGSVSNAGVWTINGTAVTIAPVGGAITLTAAAASTWSTSAGALTIDSAAALQLGTTAATSVVVGNATNTAAYTFAGTAAVTAATATAGGGQAVQATVSEYMVITFRGATRKIPLFAN